MHIYRLFFNSHISLLVSSVLFILIFFFFCLTLIFMVSLLHTHVTRVRNKLLILIFIM